MTLDPLLHASPAIQLHAAAAVAAFALGAFVLFRKKGDSTHKRLGRVWVGIMVLVAVTSFFIWEIRLLGLFSPIHLLSLGTLAALGQGVRFARVRQPVAHRSTMQATYIGALLISGLFTFLPDRIMHEVVFGPDGATPVELAVFITVVTVVLAAFILLSRRPVRRRLARLVP